jgi:hypothetical protein
MLCRCDEPIDAPMRNTMNFRSTHTDAPNRQGTTAEFFALWRAVEQS